MKRSVALMSAFLGVLSLSACERKETVVGTPTPPPAVAGAEAPPPAVVVVPSPPPAAVPVPGPPGTQGPQGPQGAQGDTGKAGDTRVIITPPAASEPK